MVACSPTNFQGESEMSDYQRFLVATACHQWELTKGSLRATLAVKGSSYGDNSGEFGKLSAKIESFIKDIEDHELHIPRGN